MKPSYDKQEGKINPNTIGFVKICAMLPERFIPRSCGNGADAGSAAIRSTEEEGTVSVLITADGCTPYSLQIESKHSAK